jgi:hypothetical protein
MKSLRSQLAKSPSLADLANLLDEFTADQLPSVAAQYPVLEPLIIRRSLLVLSREFPEVSRPGGLRLTDDNRLRVQFLAANALDFDWKAAVYVTLKETVVRDGKSTTHSAVFKLLDKDSKPIANHELSYITTSDMFMH